MKSNLQLTFSRDLEIDLEGSETFTTFDFEKLYSSLNIAPVCLCLYRFLLTNLQMDQASPELCRDLADLLCNNSFYRFKDKYYIQTKGVPIGSPLAGELAELVIRSIEETMIHNLLEETCLYVKYVDDLFVIWKNVNHSEELFKIFTDKVYGLKLNLEQMEKETIHFLDVQIQITSSTIQTTVYRKSESTPVIIPR